MLRLIFIMLVLSTKIIFSQNLKINIQPQYLIGSDKAKSKEYLFKWPNKVRCDSKSNVYIVDDKGTEIRKYDKNGKYLKTIGRAGEGPGEIKNIRSFMIDGKDNLIIIDPMLSRMTKYNSEGKYLEMKTIPKNISNSKNMDIMDYNNYLSFDISGWYASEKGNKIIMTDNNFQSINTSFAHSTIFWYDEDAFNTYENQTSSLYMATINSNKVVVAKEYYDGKIYQFEKDKGWKHTIIQGKKYSHVPYEIYSKQQAEKIMKEKRGYLISASVPYKGTRTLYSFLYWNHGAGIFNYKDKYILCFVTNYMKGKTTFAVDVYNTNAEYLGYYELNNNMINPNLDTMVLCVDHEGSFYLRQSTLDNIPVILKYKLEIK